MDSYQNLMRGQVPGIRPRSAGIAGRGGPGGGSLDTGVIARNQPFTGTLRSNTAPSFLGSQVPTSPQSFLAGATKGLRSLGRGTLLSPVVDFLLNPVEDKIVETIDPLIGSLGRNNIPGMPSYYKSVNGVNYDIRTDAGMKAYKEATGRGVDNKVRGRSGAERAQQKAAAEAADPLAMRERYGGSGDMDAGDSSTYTRQDGYVFDSDVAPPAPILPPPPSNNVPASSAEQTMMDPYAYNLAVYGQGRNLATTKNERAAVRDLGLAINRSLYPKLNKTQDINPLLQSTFPERTNDTLTGNINSRGTTLPGSMTEADSGSELATAQLQDTPYQATFRLGMMEGQAADQRMNVLNDATTLVEQLMGQAQTDEIRRRLGM